MGSVNAKNVAREVLETVRKGNKVNLGKIIKKNGYSATTATVPTQVTNTKSYREEISPIINKMEKERERLIEALSAKNLSKEKYRDMIDGLDKLTKNIQLLGGGVTAKEEIKFSWEE